CCFFFQAEDGIRDKLVTGVQTCALPICPPIVAREGAHDKLAPRSARARRGGQKRRGMRGRGAAATKSHAAQALCGGRLRGHETRSEERRVGKECRCRWAGRP